MTNFYNLKGKFILIDRKVWKIDGVMSYHFGNLCSVKLTRTVDDEVITEWQMNNVLNNRLKNGTISLLSSSETREYLSQQGGQ